MAAPLLRLGTRGSKLALTQTGLVRDALAAAVPALAAPGAIEIIAIRTTGDAIQDRPLAEAGGKGLFVKEIEEALLTGRIDGAVHSMKDMPTAQPPGLAIAAFLPREDVRDVLIAEGVQRIADLERGAIVGTSALRRKAQLLYRRPDLEIVNFRGNVDTRLAKLKAGAVDATLLALAGLKRLGLAVGTPIPEEEILPAVGQGAVCIECRADDARTRGWLAAIDHAPTATCVAAEHAMLAVLDGSCRTPIAGHAVLDANGALYLRGLIAKPDGSGLVATERRGPASDAGRLGRDAGEELKRRGGPGFFAS
ncbi:hydroxymethylbilane synthase [Enhydrobacter sp.]|jgi:hydroxymethylbilane synthase|uniref:hydroxymethylbilane synthase n=1 Tax=Enhydrobacter sp. TaxID=1894999 RepID=UPI00262A2E2C|nr:hydroxymethylbilane synthase [Enhydrobacter sp.]WIM11514.1 MAG: Porphobilinogen deaminase [Enhydrobacter sp.]